MSDLDLNLTKVNQRILQSCEAAGRSPAEITLIAVSKTVPVEAIREAYDLGLRNFGESRLQEALPKIDALPHDIDWHFIGKLQSNKVRRAAHRFKVLHSLESRTQLEELDKFDGAMDCFIEINIGEEPQKGGILPSELDEFHKLVLQCGKVRFLGLMTIGPLHLNAEEMRPFFRRLRDLNKSVGGTSLSMGMSNDFEVAIQEGATHVRVGSALFGARN